MIKIVFISTYNRLSPSASSTIVTANLTARRTNRSRLKFYFFTANSYASIEKILFYRSFESRLSNSTVHKFKNSLVLIKIKEDVWQGKRSNVVC